MPYDTSNWIPETMEALKRKGPLDEAELRKELRLPNTAAAQFSRAMDQSSLVTVRTTHNREGNLRRMIFAAEGSSTLNPYMVPWYEAARKRLAAIWPC